MSEITNRRINVRGIIYKDGKLLAVRHKHADGSPVDYYAIPGGGLDPHESLTDGMKRELFEETGIRAKVGKLLFIQQFATTREGFSEELEFFFAIDNPDDFHDIDLSKTSHGDAEIAVCEFIDPKQERIFPVFLSDVSLADYISIDAPVLIVDNFNE